METHKPDFIVDHEFNAGNDEGKLTIKPGDVLEVSYGDVTDDWWFGKFKDGDKEGYFPRSYGHIVDDEYSQDRKGVVLYCHLSKESRQRELSAIYNTMKDVEQSFLNKVSIFVDKIVAPVHIRDTAFKRDLMQESSLAVLFSVLVEIQKASRTFWTSLQNAFDESTGRENRGDVACCFQEYAPSLRLFAQYTVETSNALNSLKKRIKPLNAFLKECKLPEGVTIEQLIILPVEHYSQYLVHYEKFVHICGDYNNESSTLTAEEHDALYTALYALRDCSNEVDERLESESEKQILLTIQSRFINNPEIFSPTRRFVMEGELERVDHVKKTNKVYYAHLFSDMFVISTNFKRIGCYKFHRAVDLSLMTGDDGAQPCTTLQNVSTLEHPNVFHVVTPSFTFTFHCDDKKQMSKWMDAINGEIKKQVKLAISSGAKEESSRFSRARSTSSFAAQKSFRKPAMSLSLSLGDIPLGSMCESLECMEVATLGGYAKNVVSFLDKEFQAEGLLKVFLKVVILPLEAASRGAPLVVGDVSDGDESGRKSAATIQEKGSYITAISGLSSKNQAQATTRALAEDADMQVYLHSIQGVLLSIGEFLHFMEMSVATESKWQDKDICLGKVFASQPAKLLFQQFASNASGVLAALRILCESKLFASFRKDSEEKLRPQTIEDIIRSTLKFPSRCQRFLLDVQAENATTDNKKGFDEAIEFVSSSVDAIDAEIESKKNFEKLILIQKNFIRDTIMPDPVLTSLVTTKRKFIMDGQLVKVCRKDNKAMMFWIFNDYIVYGSSELAAGKYKWKRALDMARCSAHIVEDNNDTFSFELRSSEKSFVVIAPTSEVLHSFVNIIQETASKRKAEAGSSAVDESASTAAPVWVTDSSSSLCCVCHSEFKGIMNRKHHCRECGGVVCGDHSSKRKILTNIHASTKQRVCDDCFAGRPHSDALAPTEASTPSTPGTEKTSASAATGRLSSRFTSLLSKATATPPSTSDSAVSGSLPTTSAPVPAARPMPVPTPVPKPAKPAKPMKPPTKGALSSTSGSESESTSTAPPTPAPPVPPVKKTSLVGVFGAASDDMDQDQCQHHQREEDPTSPPTEHAASRALPIKPAMPSAPPPAPPTPTQPQSQAQAQALVLPRASAPPPLPSFPPPPPAPPPAPRRRASVLKCQQQKPAIEAPTATPPPPPPPPPRPPPPAPRPPLTSTCPPPLTPSDSQNPSPAAVEASPPPKPSRRGSAFSDYLLDSIKKGDVLLKKVEDKVVEPSSKAQHAGGGLLGALANVLSERRLAIMDDDDDDDSDNSGWSSGSDGD